MSLVLLVLLLLLLPVLPAVPAAAGDSEAPSAREIKQMISFGVTLGKQGLWKEALYRWQEALRHDPDNPRLFNNIAVALECQGDLEGAREAYRRAEELELKSRYLHRNMENFEELFTALEKYESEYRSPPAGTPEAGEGEGEAAGGEPAAEVVPPAGEPPEEDGE